MGVDAVMAVRCPRVFTDEEVRELAYEACSAFGEDSFWITYGNEGKGYEAKHAITRCPRGEWSTYGGDEWLRVFVATRYYGPGYERGDFPLVYMLARWLEAKTGGEVWYGGDDLESLLPFHEAAREEMWQHFVAVNHHPYRAVIGQDPGEPPTCPLCAVPTTRFGWGKGYAAYYCPCGYQYKHQNGEGKWSTPSERRR